MHAWAGYYLLIDLKEHTRYSGLFPGIKTFNIQDIVLLWLLALQVKMVNNCFIIQ